MGNSIFTVLYQWLWLPWEVWAPWAPTSSRELNSMTPVGSHGYPYPRAHPDRDAVVHRGAWHVAHETTWEPMRPHGSP